MTTYINNPVETTLGEYIKNHYPDFTIEFGAAPLDMDITHGLEVNYCDNREHGYGETAWLYPFVKWSDGLYKSCHYWGDKYYLELERR